jgi:tetratricopeptide (TPR) repeat protein
LQSLGEHEAAEVAAKEALDGPDEARAEALMTLGRLAFMFEPPKVKEAEEYFGRAAPLWRSLGEKAKVVDALNNRAVARSFGGKHDEAGFQEALEAAGDHLPSHALVLDNIGQGLSLMRRFQEAAQARQAAYKAAAASGAWQRATLSLHNLAADYEHLKQPRQAVTTYLACRDLAEQNGNRRIVGACMMNIGRIEGDLNAYEEGVKYLERWGFGDDARHINFYTSYDKPHNEPESVNK